MDHQHKVVSGGTNARQLRDHEKQSDEKKVQSKSLWKAVRTKALHDLEA